MITEVHYCSTNNKVPNSRLPVLIHKNALAKSLEEHEIRKQIEQNDWIHGVSGFQTIRGIP